MLTGRSSRALLPLGFGFLLLIISVTSNQFLHCRCIRAGELSRRSASRSRTSPCRPYLNEYLDCSTAHGSLPMLKIAIASAADQDKITHGCSSGREADMRPQAGRQTARHITTAIAAANTADSSSIVTIDKFGEHLVLFSCPVPLLFP